MSIAVNVNDPTNSGVNNTKSTTGSNSLTGSNASDLQGSFLTLLVAQLKNRDPTNPMQNNELTTQLAQISTVSGIEKLNTTLGSVSGQINSAQSLQAASLIGHGVMIPAPRFWRAPAPPKATPQPPPRRLALSSNRRLSRSLQQSWMPITWWFALLISASEGGRSHLYVGWQPDRRH